MKLWNRTILLLMLFFGISAALSACGKVGGFSKVNTGTDRLAIKGFDTVAYFAAGTAAKGDPKYEFAWNGAKWLFSNAENLERFRHDPEAYAPQFGGYCSYAVSKGYTADGDPEAWKLVDGKLYLNYSLKVKTLWEKDEITNISKGQENWAGFEIHPPKHR